MKKKNNVYRLYKKLKNDCFYDKFSFYCKLVKTTIKTNRFRWLKSVDENFKSLPKQFRKYHSLGKTDAGLIQLDTGGVVLNKSRDIAEAFSKHFKSVYSSLCSGTFSSVNKCTDILSLVLVSNSDVQNAIAVGPNDISSFVMKGYSESLYFFSGLVLILSYLSILFLNCGSKHQLSLLKKGKRPLLEIIGP
jgi:hypothetical protein